MLLLKILVVNLAGPLLPRQHDTADDYTIEIDAGKHGRRTVGRIVRVARSSCRVAFFWTITGPAAPDGGIGMVGKETGLDEAKTALRAAFDKLLYLACMAKNGELGWHVGADRVGG